MCGNPGKPAHGWQPCVGYPLFYCTRTPRIRIGLYRVFQHAATGTAVLFYLVLKGTYWLQQQG
jgi:hypothetical protein